MADILNVGQLNAVDINHDYTASANCLIMVGITPQNPDNVGGSGDFRGSIQGFVYQGPGGKTIRGVASAGWRGDTFGLPTASFTMVVLNGETFRLAVTDDFAGNFGSVWTAFAKCYPLP